MTTLPFLHCFTPMSDHITILVMFFWWWR